ncbi:MICAL-like protein 1 isoform X3 [Amphibalanus amphitrite]|uniref:MICAL-like protein 1 isoform X3 n=1 Tax=Amphibalanus amphitrite TaxID=1232801 RepID=UPI001C8FB33E|nr:MICAL-like protein 1 isoform X3 [Amphibalanus amphitrite]
MASLPLPPRAPPRRRRKPCLPVTEEVTVEHVATSVRQRQPCSVCQLPVFLAERMLIERRLVHRTCFKCARCGSQLSTANYYITEDGQFCCEVCPDEEIGGRVEKTAAVLAHERAVLAGPTDDPLSEDADAVLEREESEAAARAPGAADSSSSDSESDSAESESESESAATETLCARTAGVAKDGHGDGTGRGGEGSENGVRSERGDVSGESERDATTGASTSSDTTAVATADETKTSDNKTEAGSEETSKPQTSDDGEVELRVSAAPPAPAPRSGSPPSASSGADGATQRLSLVQQRLQQFKAAERPQPAPRRAGRSSQAAGTESGEQTPPEKSAGEKGEEKDEGSDPAKEESEKETDAAAAAAATATDIAAAAAAAAAAESSNPFGDDEEDEKEKDELNPFGSDGEEEVEDVTKDKDAAEEIKETSSKDVVYPSLPSEETSETLDVESSPAAEDEKVEETTVPSVSVTEPTPPKPAPPKEYNPFDEDEDEDEEQAEPAAAASTETAEVKSEPAPLEEEYPDDLNPFGDEEEEEPSPAPVEEKPVKPQSLNPFGDSDEEDGEEEVTPASSAQSTPAKAASGSREINPFEKPPRPPPPTLDRRKLASMKAAVTPPRPPEPPGLVREQRAGSLTSLTSTGKKKRPAPRPPGVESSPSRSQGVSPAHSPSTLRKRHAPPPPPPPPVAVSGTPPPAPAPAPETTGAEPEPEAHSPERSKAEKEQDNYTKQVNNLTNKSIQGKYKRRKGPAPLRPKPIKRQVKTLPPKETQTELHDINVRQLELERQGVELEKTIRQLTEQDDKSQKELDSTAPYGLDIEDMILQLFELVNEKNALFRRQAELMYMRRQHRLEEEHAELEYEIRCLMMKADSLKTEMERQREQRLIERLVSVVEQRNEIVTMLEMERIREIQEDATIDHHMGLYTAERVGSVEPAPDKKKKKKKKKDKKEKEGSSKKKGRDADKDIDEKEQATEKKKSKKIKLKKLFS